MIKPSVSILVPIFNVENYIERCVISLMEQTYENIEYIFVNDCTQDNSITILNNILKHYPQRKNIKIINHENNKGLSATRNTGINYATSEWISFVDSDDYLEKEAIEKMITTALKNNSDIVVSEFNIVSEKEKKLFMRPHKSYNKTEYIQSLLHWNEIDLTLWGKLFKKSIFIENNIRSFEGYNFGEDFAVLPRVVYYAKKISFIDYVSYNYEYNNNNSYTKKISERSLISLTNIAKKISQFFITKDDHKLYINDLCKGLINIQLWIYTTNRNSKFIEDIQNFRKENNIKVSGINIIINYLLNHKLYNSAIRFNKIYKKICSILNL